MNLKDGISGVTGGSSVKTRNMPPGSGNASPEVPAAKPDTGGAHAQTEQETSPAPPSATGHALRNAFDAIALLETANSAIEHIFANLQQARELAQQLSERVAPDEEYALLNQRLQHQLNSADGIATTTLFKGHRILHGGLGSAYFRLDLGSGKLICINLDTSLRRTSLGSLATASSADLSARFGSGRVVSGYTTPAIRDLNFFSAPRHASFNVDSTPTGLFRDWRGKPEEAATALQQHLNTQRNGGNYTVTYHDHRFTLSHSSGRAPVLSAASMRGAEFIGGTSRSAPPALRLNLEQGDFTIKVGEGPSVSIIGSFSHLAELATALNLQQQEAISYANPSTGCLEISAYKTLTLGGKFATSSPGLGFAATSYPPGGSLATVNLLDRAASREALLRIDAALTTLTSQRIIYNRLQQRFHQAILAIQASHERAGSAPHIDDATLAAESLFRACSQLPQQTTTTLQAQANAVPNNVRMLLNQEFHETPLCFCDQRCENGKERCP